jgi:hypothetical protein
MTIPNYLIRNRLCIDVADHGPIEGKSIMALLLFYVLGPSPFPASIYSYTGEQVLYLRRNPNRKHGRLRYTFSAEKLTFWSEKSAFQPERSAFQLKMYLFSVHTFFWGSAPAIQTDVREGDMGDIVDVRYPCVSAMGMRW